MSKHTISAAATGLPEASRRQLMLGGVAVALLSAVPAAEAAATDISNPDEELISLVDRFFALNAEINRIGAMDHPYMEARGQVHSNKAGLEVRKGDVSHYGVNMHYWSEDGFYRFGKIDELPGVERRFNEYAADHYYEKRGRRTAEIQAAYAAWKARLVEFDRMSGITAREDQIEKLCEQQDTIEEEIIASPVYTLAGIAAKARYLDYYVPPSWEHDRVAERTVFALVKNLVALDGRGV